MCARRLDLAEWFAEFCARWRVCMRCDLDRHTTKHAPGDGALVRPIMFIGEGPGKQEDLAGVPFVGPAGQLLREAIRKAGSSLLDYFLTNLVACRPCDFRDGPNRPPFPQEVSACEPRLRALVGVLNPRAIIVVGYQTSELLPEGIRREGWARGGLYVIEHPASILRRGGSTGPRGERWRKCVAAALGRISKGG